MYNIAKSNGPEMRQQFLRDLANARAAENNTKAASEIKSILAQEEIRSSFRRINFARGKRGSIGVSFITYIDEDGQRKETQQREKVELEIMKNNQRKITKNHATPPYGGTLLGHLGKLGGGKYVQQILEGEYACPPNLDKYTAAYIRALKMPAAVRRAGRVSDRITPEDWKGAWAKQKERTSSSVSGIHFGHYKAAIQDERLCKIDADMADIAFTSGFVTSRWKRSVDIMIPKKVKSSDVKDLRIIVLYEADYNTINKIISKRTMRHAESNGTIPIEHEGGRKNRKAINHPVNKSLTITALTQQRQPAVFVGCDVSSCFDLIAHNMGVIAHIRQGMAPLPIQGMFNCLLYTSPSPRDLSTSRMPSSA